MTPPLPWNLFEIKNPFGSFQTNFQANAWWVPFLILLKRCFFSLKVSDWNTHYTCVNCVYWLYASVWKCLAREMMGGQKNQPTNHVFFERGSPEQTQHLQSLSKAVDTYAKRGRGFDDHNFYALLLSSIFSYASSSTLFTVESVGRSFGLA